MIYVYAVPMSIAINRLELIAAIASKQHTGTELSEMFDMTVPQLRKFVEANRPDIEAAAAALELVRKELGTDEEREKLLWVRDQNKRLEVYQTMIEILYLSGRVTLDTVILRELRSYLLCVANELGQLQHRGSATGDGTTVTYSIEGVDMENLR